MSSALVCVIIAFLSTLSLRRATKLTVRQSGRLLDFYPRSPCGERRTYTLYGRVRADFYPRSPCGERRDTYVVMEATKVISIHALLAESDGNIG